MYEYINWKLYRWSLHIIVQVSQSYLEFTCRYTDRDYWNLHAAITKLNSIIEIQKWYKGDNLMMTLLFKVVLYVVIVYKLYIILYIYDRTTWDENSIESKHTWKRVSRICVQLSTEKSKYLYNHNNTIQLLRYSNR